MAEIPPPQPVPTWPTAVADAGRVVPASPVWPTTVAQVSTSGNAIVALVLALASWVVCPIVFAIIALIFASLGKKEIEASGGLMHGVELVTAARIVAWINIGVWAALLVIALIVGIVVLVAGSLASLTPRSAGVT